MIAVRMVQVAADEVVRVVAVRDRGVAAVDTVDVVFGMLASPVIGCASVRVLSAHSDDVLIDMIIVHVVQVAVVEVIRMAIVRDGCVATARAMHVKVVTSVLLVIVSAGDCECAQGGEGKEGPFHRCSILSDCSCAL